ncbi:catalase-related domain-containing protein [Sorangium cellulosum]
MRARSHIPPRDGDAAGHHASRHERSDTTPHERRPEHEHEQKRFGSRERAHPDHAAGTPGDGQLQGRTFSYSDTQRYRVGPNYLQLPINQPRVKVSTNQRDGQMAYHVDSVEDGADPHVNYEPSSRNAPRVARPAGRPHEPAVSGRVQRRTIARTNDYGQAGERYRAFEPWERDELVKNLVDALSQCDRGIQERMVGHLVQCDKDYGRRVAEGLGVPAGPGTAAR